VIQAARASTARIYVLYIIELIIATNLVPVPSKVNFLICLQQTRGKDPLLAQSHEAAVLAASELVEQNQQYQTTILSDL
jgi:hypothetical protein